MDQRISIVTLAVGNLEASIAFFERLGWCRSLRQFENIAFFQCGSMALALYPRDKLAEDAGVPSADAGFEGFTLAYNTRARDDVNAVLAEAEAAGATIMKPAQDVFWGGYSGYFRDLDGHLWEVAWNPFLDLDDDGAVRLAD